ncbi:MAG: Gfo/Idh/MocA family oxidoreductase [Firmicutes bacterium]|nr:Gfo/Idh/MocA family oxidoreductase [Bacillota bacterium]
MKKLRYGLIGFSQGFYATTYTEALLQRKDVDVVACCDLGMPSDYVRECASTTAEEFCLSLQVPLVSDLNQFFDLDLDMVMIATEVWEHKQYTILALEHGCHVFVGKPLSFLTQDVEEVSKKAEEKGLIVLPGQPLRYESGFIEAAEKIKAGRIGKPLNIRLFLNHEAMIHQAWERDPARSGGPLGTFGVYLFDLIRWVTGQEFAEVFAYGDNFVFSQIPAHDVVQIVGRLCSGTLANLNLVSTITWPYPFVLLDVVGTMGVLRTNYDNYQTIIQGPSGASLGDIKYSPMGTQEILHFVDCCQGLASPRMTLEDMLKAAKGIEAAMTSLTTGKKCVLR